MQPFGLPVQWITPSFTLQVSFGSAFLPSLSALTMNVQPLSDLPSNSGVNSPSAARAAGDRATARSRNAAVRMGTSWARNQAHGRPSVGFQVNNFVTGL